MSLPEILFIALALAMDSFAVSVAAGTSGWADTARARFRLSFHLGLFQFMMPVAGWYAGVHVAPLVSAFDHWVAFGLLLFVGARMIHGGLAGEDRKVGRDPTRGYSLVLLSVATSIDALAVGFSLAMVRIGIWYPSMLIGVVTAAMSLAGIRLGRFLGQYAGSRMEIAGGIILLVIGFRILLSGLAGNTP